MQSDLILLPKEYIDEVYVRIACQRFFNSDPTGIIRGFFKNLNT